jgi:hypothetical protein
MDTPILTALIMAAASVLGGLIVFIATRGRTRTDAKTALDARIDARVTTQLEGAWKRIDEQDAHIKALKTQNKTQARQITELRAHADIAERREVLIYRHTRALREHILRELPPPPPTMPVELRDWFSQYEHTEDPNEAP